MAGPARSIPIRSGLARPRRAQGYVSLRWNAATCVAVILAAIFLPLAGSYDVYVASLAGVYVISSLGENLLMGHGGIASLGQGGLIALGAYGAADLATHGASFAESIAGAAVIGFVVGLAVGLPGLRLGGHSLALVTFFFALAIGELVEVVNSPLTGGGNGVAVSQGATSGSTLLYVTAAVIVLVTLHQVAMVNGPYGAALRLSRDSEVAARLFGIGVNTYRLAAFAYAGLLAGLSGGLLAFDVKFVTPSIFDLWLSVYVLVGAVIGGLRSPGGAVIGGAVVGAIPQLLSQYIGLTDILFGIVVIGVVVLPRVLTGRVAMMLRFVSRAGRHHSDELKVGSAGLHESEAAR